MKSQRGRLGIRRQINYKKRNTDDKSKNGMKPKDNEEGKNRERKDITTKKRLSKAKKGR